MAVRVGHFAPLLVWADITACIDFQVLDLRDSRVSEGRASAFSVGVVISAWAFISLGIFKFFFVTWNHIRLPAAFNAAFMGVNG
jgi:hypothetical protein